MERGRASRFYRALLRVLPAGVRRRFGREMEETFHAEWRSVRGGAGQVGRMFFLLRTALHTVRFGVEERWRGWTGSTRGGSLMGWDDLGRDVRLAARSLTREPGFAITSVVALALGIGLSAAAFSVVWGTLLKGLPFQDGAALVHLERRDAERDNLAVTPHDFEAWRQAQRSFVDLAAYTEAVVVVAVDDGTPERVRGSRIQPGAFSLLGTAPALGRLFTSDDDAVDAPPVVLLSHGLWTRYFAGASDVLGRTLRINQVPHTVVGVMPAGFRFPLSDEFWLPLRLDLSQVVRGEGRLDVFGRLRDGVTLDAARTEFQALSVALAQAHPGTNAGIQAQLRPYVDEYVDRDFRAMVIALLVAALLVLAVASMNVANLMLVRGARRARELAVRVSLGAARGRVAQHLLAEGLVLGAASALLGTALAWVGVGWFAGRGARPGTFQLAHGGDVPFWWDVRLDVTSLAFVLGVTLVTMTLAGLVPALRALRTHPASLLRGEGRGGTPRKGLASRVVVVLEIAVAGGVLTVSGLMAKSVLRLADVGGAVETRGVVVASVALPDARLGGDEGRFPDMASRRAFWAALRDRVAAMPGVEAVSVATAVPFIATGHESLTVPGFEGDDEVDEALGVVDEAYFPLLGVEVVEGRGFDDGDGPGAEPVVVVNRSFADRYFQGAALNRVVEVPGPGGTTVAARVVGVVPDLFVDGIQDRRPEGVYRPLGQAGATNRRSRFDRRELRYAQVLIRTSGQVPVASGLREALAALAPGTPVYGITTLDETLDRVGGQYRLYGVAYMVFGAVALFMVLLGLYGLVAYTVGQQRREVGIRVALGAAGVSVTWLVLRRALVLVVTGLAGGFVLSVWLRQALGLVLYQVEPGDPGVLAGVFSTLLLTTVAAAAIPAWEASRVDPLDAMRAD